MRLSRKGEDVGELGRRKLPCHYLELFTLSPNLVLIMRLCV